MKLKYTGPISPIAINGIENPKGGMGISVKTGDIFECSASVGARLIDSAKDKFEEVTANLLEPKEKMAKVLKNK